MKLVKPNTNKFHFDNIFAEQSLETEDFEIIQIGDLLCDGDTVIEEHRQEVDLELTFVAEGKGTLYTDGFAAVAEKEHVYLSFRGDLHKIVSAKLNTLRYFYFAINIKNRMIYEKLFLPLERAKHAPDTRLLHLPDTFPQMSGILRETKNFNDTSLFLIQSYICEILVSLHRNAVIAKYTGKSAANIETDIIYNIVNYIDVNCANIRAVPQIAEMFNYNCAYLGKLFKHTTGTSLHEYLQSAKMDKALTLLHARQSVTDIAYQLGYSSIHNFTRAFKKKFGLPPSDFRRRD